MNRYCIVIESVVFRRKKKVTSFVLIMDRVIGILMVQCARRWFDENDVNHLANFGKYLSAMVAAGARLTYAREPESKLWLAMVLVTSITATVYQLYWDFVKDWGFFNLKCKNALLRDELILKNKIIYYVSIVSFC